MFNEHKKRKKFPVNRLASESEQNKNCANEW